ncbi:MAG: hypothetical protein WC595_04930 [Candidatus Nanoarchaeia archaeon]
MSLKTIAYGLGAAALFGSGYAVCTPNVPAGYESQIPNYVSSDPVEIIKNAEPLRTLEEAVDAQGCASAGIIASSLVAAAGLVLLFKKRGGQ